MTAIRCVGFRRAALSVLLTVMPVACTTVVPQRAPGAGVVAQLSLDRFLQAVNQRDLDTMGQTFGTVDGPMLDTGSTFGCFFKKIGSWFGGSSCMKRRDVEVQMEAIASILKHDDYKIVREEPVAGRMNVATRMYVDLTKDGREIADVPFVLVRTSDGQWLVEEVDLKKVMAG